MSFMRIGMAISAVFLVTNGAVAAGGDPDHYGWVSILPPLVAIAMALITRQVIPSLFLGIFTGAWALNGFTLVGFGLGFLEVAQKYIKNALSDPDHAAIIIFSLMIGGTVGVVNRNGGMAGIVNSIIGWISNPQRAQVGTATMGLAIFFDDYANTLVVGNTMRSVTDKMKVSREKLAYLVDSTAAPVACIALVTTWVGFELGLIGDAIKPLGISETPYSIFLNSIAYAFYPILALFFVYVVASTGKDFGPMYKAEAAARAGQMKATESTQNADMEAVMPESHIEPKALNAAIPIGALVITVLVSLYFTGYANVLSDGKIPVDDITLKDIIGAADSYKALMWSTLVSSVIAIGMSVGRKVLTMEGALNAWVSGAKGMMMAFMILVMAWALAATTNDLGTANYLVSALSGEMPYQIIPTLVFLLAAITAFSTGTSWGTMGILMPLVVPLAFAFIQVGTGDGAAVDASKMHIVYSSVACVLAGAVWGDHCSPISDTTILSSLASGCDHIEHVRTQMPYALTVGAAAVFLGTLPAGYGMPWWLGLSVGAGLLYGLMQLVGKKQTA